MKSMLWACTALVFVAAGPATVHAQQAGWKPEANVEFVVGAGAGGENDRIARQRIILTSVHCAKIV
jgi:tripartite-type tricarboxylate transporter receptor subunit TctC